MVPDCEPKCPGTKDNLDCAFSYYFEGVQNTYKHLITFPDYSETDGIVLENFKAYYGSNYTPQEYTKKSLQKTEASYNGRGNQVFTNFLGEVAAESIVEGQEREAFFQYVYS